ncbi:hypothetical protein BTVI_53446 [Pitangus sulphuratus]|nr:hypothetical protein BTVI_53446 [Pitangus sulphuratus]
MVKTVVKQLCPCGPWRFQCGADIHLQLMEETHAGADGKKSVTPWEAVLQQAPDKDVWTHGERSPLWSRAAGGTRDPAGDLWQGRLFLRNCSPWKGTHTGAFCEDM